MRSPYHSSNRLSVLGMLSLIAAAGLPMEAPYSPPERYEPEPPDLYAQLRAAESAVANAGTPGAKRKAQRRLDALWERVEALTAPTEASNR